jgi:transposase-like protein
MVSPLFFYQLTLIALVWLCLMLPWAWPSDLAAGCPTPPEPPGSRPKRRREPTPFAGLTPKPHCDACEPGRAPRPQTPAAPPPRIVSPRGRRRQVDTARHCCPNPDCPYRGWVGWGHLRAHGHPNGGPWRQRLCVVCRRSVLETLGTILHGTRTSVALIVRVIVCLAEGLGIRGTARVFAVDPHTVLPWLVAAAEPLRACSPPFLHAVRVRQGQRDALLALLRAVKNGAVSAAEASERLERAPQWVWVAMAPERQRLLTLDGGDRTLALAPRVLPQVVQVLAPDCAPLLFPDGFRESLTAWLTHDGPWGQPSRRQDTGPPPKARWMLRPPLL